MVLADGFAWNGTTYKSLSQVARAITGTRWNGPRFFGLRDSKDGQMTKPLAAAPRHLHTGVDRSRARAGLQLAGRSARPRGLCQEPGP